MKNVLLASVFAIVFLTSCGQNSQTSTSKQKLRISINRDLATLDPRRGADVVSSVVHFLLFERLTKTDENDKIVLALAEKVDISEDKMLYTFHLRDTTWSDGSPVTAEDFESAWKKNLDPTFPCPNAHLFYPIKNAEAAKKGLVQLDEVGIRAIDPKTLQVELNNPTPQFLAIVSFCSFSPVKSGIDEEHPGWANGPSEHYICNGAYTLRSWKHNHETVLVKNPMYWNCDALSIDTIQMSVIDNEMTALHMYENGELDMIASPLSPFPLDALRDYIHKEAFTLIKEPGTTVCFFNTEQFPFNNLNIRKAFALAVHRQEIVSNITQLGEEIATGPVPSILKDHNHAFFKDNDIEKARHYLKLGLQDLGIEKASALDGIVYHYCSSEVSGKIAQTLQQQWFKALGVHVKIEQVEYKILLDKLAKRSYMAAQGIWLAQYQDQMNILERFKSKKNVKNYAGWENEAFTKLLEDSNYACTEEERLQILEKAESIFVDHMPVCPIFHWKTALLTQPYLKIPSCSPAGGTFFEKLCIDLQGQGLR